MASPNVLHPWDAVQCIVQCIDVFGKIAATLVNNTVSHGPAVVSLPIASLQCDPQNSTDIDYFANTPVTVSSAFRTAFFGFPPLAPAGNVLAAVQYTVGTMLNHVSNIYDDIVPVQPLDRSGGSFLVSNYLMVIAGVPRLVNAVALGSFAQSENIPATAFLG
ncbi:hypothetical protein HDU88_000452 [Geranomyces variabilis]|nr:hypothetical protein HDU88_000452 [Geranomyces variabilis]